MIEPTEAPLEVGSFRMSNPYRDWSNERLAEAIDEPTRIAVRLNSLRQSWASEHPETLAAMEVACDFFHAIFLYPDILTAQRLTDEQKAISARLEHNQVHHLLYAGLPETSVDIKKIVYSTASTLQAASAIANAHGDPSISLWWSGIKNELAIVKFFYQMGYQVLLPNYSEDKQGLDNETLQLDVRSGVDMIAINKDKGVAWLVDAKGRVDLDQAQVVTKPYVYTPGSKESWMVNHLRATQLRDNDVYRATIILPGRVLYPLGSGSSFAEELTRFCRLPDAVTQSITQFLEIKK